MFPDKHQVLGQGRREGGEACLHESQFRKGQESERERGDVADEKEAGRESGREGAKEAEPPSRPFGRTLS